MATLIEPVNGFENDGVSDLSPASDSSRDGARAGDRNSGGRSSLNRRPSEERDLNGVSRVLMARFVIDLVRMFED